MKFYKRCLEKKFSDLSIKASTSRIMELSAENSSPIEINPLVVTTSKRWVDDDSDDVVFLGSNDEYKLDG